jgi:hypothetical protein
VYKVSIIYTERAARSTAFLRSALGVRRQGRPEFLGFMSKALRAARFARQ